MAAAREAYRTLRRPPYFPHGPGNPDPGQLGRPDLPGGLGEIGLNLMTDLIRPSSRWWWMPDSCSPKIPCWGSTRHPRTFLTSGAPGKLTALVLTHGHEDHIGAVPSFLKEFPVPVYGTPLTLALLREKLREHGLLNDADLREIRLRTPRPWGP